eukprot:gene22231-26808_t
MESYLEPLMEEQLSKAVFVKDFTCLVGNEELSNHYGLDESVYIKVLPFLFLQELCGLRKYGGAADQLPIHIIESLLGLLGEEANVLMHRVLEKLNDELKQKTLPFETQIPNLEKAFNKAKEIIPSVNLQQLSEILAHMRLNFQHDLQIPLLSSDYVTDDSDTVKIRFPAFRDTKDCAASAEEQEEWCRLLNYASTGTNATEAQSTWLPLQVSESNRPQLPGGSSVMYTLQPQGDSLPKVLLIMMLSNDSADTSIQQSGFLQDYDIVILWCYETVPASYKCILDFFESSALYNKTEQDLHALVLRDMQLSNSNPDDHPILENLKELHWRRPLGFTVLLKGNSEQAIKLLQSKLYQKPKTVLLLFEVCYCPQHQQETKFGVTLEVAFIEASDGVDMVDAAQSDRPNSITVSELVRLIQNKHADECLDIIKDYEPAEINNVYLVDFSQQQPPT